MQKRNIHSGYCLAAMLLLVLSLWSAPAMAQQERTPSSGALRIEGVMKTGMPVMAVFDLGSYEIPRGTYTSINIRMKSGPEGKKPTVLPGYPESTLTFHQPGTYVMRFILSRVSKSSCGGAEAVPLVRETRTLEIE
jgi:hypothetical protein